MLTVAWYAHARHRTACNKQTAQHTHTVSLLASHPSSGHSIQDAEDAWGRAGHAGGRHEPAGMGCR
eukprot:1394734-Rhodomonas_salina.1